MKRVLILGFILVLSGWEITEKSAVRKNQMEINEAYLECLMFDNDPNSIQKCSDLRWGAKQALYNKIKVTPNIAVDDLEKATPSNTD